MPEKIRDEFHLPVRHKTFTNSLEKNVRKLSRTKLSAFFFSQNSTFAEKISKEKDFHST